MNLSLRWRLWLAAAGLVLACASLGAVAYALWPIDSLREEHRPAPTLFAPPSAAGEMRVTG